MNQPTGLTMKFVAALVLAALALVSTPAAGAAIAAPAKAMSTCMNCA